MVSEVKQVSGRGIPLVGNDIDTDRIIPARFLRGVTFDGLGAQVFADDRTQSQGHHPFDRPEYQGANLLVVNANFGCGSSREHAPQALSRWGIENIGESFAEIFFGNCLSLGIPCVTADAATVQQLQELIQATPEGFISLNLESLQVVGNGWRLPVSLAEGTRQSFLSGTWDACGQLLANPEAVRQTAARLPYLSWSAS